MALRAATPAVTVLMPVRDAADTLSECLDSIQAQRLEDFELLVMDDGSGDQSRDIVAARAASDPRIRLVAGPRRGLVATLADGLRVARAPLVARMDADDLMDPERLGLQRDFLEANPATAVVGSRVEAFPAPGVGAGMAAYLRWQNGCVDRRSLRDEIYVESPLTHPERHVPARRGAGGRRVPGRGLSRGLRAVASSRPPGARAGEGRSLPAALAQGEASLSRVDPRYSRDAFDRLRARYLAGDGRIGGGRPLAFWGAGRRTRQRTRHLVARGVAPDAWIDVDPRKVGGRLAGVPVEPPGWLRGRAPRPFVLSWVASHGARERIGAELEEMGYRRGEDYLAVG